MGLDMYAYTVNKEDKDDEECINYTEDYEFEWRKHAKLHQFMHDHYYALVDEGTIEEDSEHVEKNPMGAFNCIPLYLDEDILEQLQELVEKDELPESEGGFFWGHQFQEESAKEYKKQDLEFCKWAIEATKLGHSVYYKCWF